MRSALAALFALGASAACTGVVPTGDDGETPEQAAAREYFVSTAFPTLVAASCSSCHASTAGADFLAGAPDATAAYHTVRDFDPPVINTQAPASSRLLTKGIHSGPALTPEQAATLLEWVNFEVDALPDDNNQILETPRITPQICTAGEPGEPTCPINTIDLTPIGAPGSSVAFTVEPLVSGLYLSDLTITASAAGVYLEHPLFLSWSDQDTKVPDDIDRFFATKLNLAPSTTDFIDGGTAAFMTFAPANPISITFKKIDAYQQGGGGGGGGGCKVVTAFTQSAQPQLATKCAGPCHAGGNINAKNAVDMTLMTDLSADGQQRACNQILTRVNKLDIPNSGILLAPDPNSGTAHQFKDGDFASFRDNAIVPWATMERDAP